MTETSPQSLKDIELPSDLRHVFDTVGNHLVGAVLVVLGVAVGKGAVLRTGFCPRPLSPGMGFLIGSDQSETLDDACQAIIQCLHDQGDKRLLRMNGGAKAIQAQIQQVEEERQAFFGADVVRDETVEGRFLARIGSLNALLTPAMVIENPGPGTLDLAVQNNGGAGLLVYYKDGWFPRELDVVKSDPRNLAFLNQSLQGKTPEISFMKSSKNRQIVRPLVGIVMACKPETISRLVCFAHPLVREFCEQLILARAPHINAQGIDGTGPVQLPAFWASRIEQLIDARDSGLQRQLTLCRGAASESAAYCNEIATYQSEQLRWFRKSPITAHHISSILHLWKGTKLDEITEKTMRAGNGLARWLARESAATARACVAAGQERAARQAAAVMLQKLKSFERPTTRRELFQRYDDERRELHDPTLELLLRTGQVHWVNNNRLEPTPQTGAKV